MIRSMTQPHAIKLSPPRRQWSRLSTNLPARITTLHGSHSAILLDLSLTGARFQLPHLSYLDPPLMPEQAIELQWDRYSAFGLVAWAGRGSDLTHAGLAFEQWITPKSLIDTRDLQDEFVRKGGFLELARNRAREWAQGYC